ncbi:elongation factor 4 [Candidatus Saccharibacteria bacterium]|nr:elongation factor 4 [Candidatus Saccharibacteria bacterium]
MDRIRNFCIIAHIDHGKSTLADRMLELTGTVQAREMKAQLLDQMDLEREKGITIKLQPVRMNWQAHQLNLIDTPGHVDFSYEVSRSLAACEGAILVVDAAQGIQAQTLANVYLALEANLTIIPVLNKIDLPAAEPERVAKEISALLGCEPSDVLRISAKEGTGVTELIDRVIEHVPPPSGQPDKPTRALIFDSVYDEYRGVILYIRLIDGELKKGQDLFLMASGKNTLAVDIGYFSPQLTSDAIIHCGQIGYIATNLKTTADARVGDTVTDSKLHSPEALPGYKKVQPYVYAGFFPASAEDYPSLKDAIEKLTLNDSALAYEPENSQVLGYGFRLGFLGLLHLDIVKARLEREYGLSLVVTNPSVDYKVKLINGDEVDIKSASELPEPTRISEIQEPWIKGEIIVPSGYVGSVIQLINSVRGIQKDLSYIDQTLALVNFEAPLANVLTDFYDDLKSVTSGYGSFNYELMGYRPEDLVKVDVLVAGELVDSLSLMVHRSESLSVGRKVIDKLKDVIPRQLFEVSLQAAIGAKIIAREDVKALGKNVTAKLYGGDISRKKKLWAKQKEGKKRLKKIGQVDIPPEAFMVMLKKD